MNWKRLALIPALAGLFILAPVARTLRVMTFNVRYPSPGDGSNLWDLRRDLLVRTIHKFRPDILGTQELFQLQGEYIAGKLPGYAWFGISRYGNHENEHMGIFYRKDRFRIVDSGNFWLSQTPDVPGSQSWGTDLPRMVTWALFETGGKQRFYFFNTHFPHRQQDAAARLECARVLADRLKQLPGEVPVVLTGDFNTGADSEPYGILTGDLQDAWKSAAIRTGPEGTTHGFSGTPGRRRIDWILYRGFRGTKQAETVVYHKGKSYPSDHFPVTAILYR